jgi:hypothetical protein
MTGDPLRTRVGHAGWTDNRFGGVSVSTELSLHSRWWNVLARGIASRSLEAWQCDLLDDLTACACAADPRIWPLKAVRLGSAWGHVAPGLAAGLFVTDGLHGPPSVVKCAQVLVEIAGELGDGDDGLLGSLVDERLGARVRPLPGFGVARRPRDERVLAFESCVARRGPESLRWWSLLLRLESLVVDRRKTPINIAGATAATLLDCGFAPFEMYALATVVMLPSLLANAHEGAVQAPAVLQRLPASAVRYVGPPPRKSPRAR